MKDLRNKKSHKSLGLIVWLDSLVRRIKLLNLRARREGRRGGYKACAQKLMCSF